MAEKFDPSLSRRYYEWLSIAPEDQPPTLYRLLGLRTFEDDPTVIEGAADRQMSHLRTFQSGKHSKESQKILNHVASARVTLLNKEKKEQYDKLLREQMKLEAEGSVSDDESASRHEEISTTLVEFLDAVELGKLRDAAEETRKKGNPAVAGKPAREVAIGVGVLLVLVVAVLIWKLGGDKDGNQGPREVAAKSGEQGEPSAPVKPAEPKRPADATTPTRAGVSTLEKPPVDTFPIGKWVPLLTSPNELVGWEGVNEKVKYSKGVIELDDAYLVYPVTAKDMMIRVKVKRMSGGSVVLYLRASDRGRYQVTLSSEGTFEVRKGVSGGGALLKTVTTPEKYKDGLELGFAAIGDTLTVYANQQPVVQVRDSSLKEGHPAIVAYRGKYLFRDVEIQILKK